MDAYSCKPISSYGSGYFKRLDPFLPCGSFSGPQSLVLDDEIGELIKAPIRAGKKGISEAKSVAALKNHSEAERRRRERINAHLATLRGLMPCTDKMDKAALLTEVISQMKELKKNAVEATNGLLVPIDQEEVKVEPCTDGSGALFIRASICCECRPELLSDLRKSLDALNLTIVKSELSTLGGWLKTSFIFTGKFANVDTKELVSSVKQALNSVLEKGSASPEYSPRTTLPIKRRRISSVETSSSSS